MDATGYAASLGFAQAFFNADPELSQLIRNAVSGQWDTQQFQGAFMNTTWYRTRSSGIRQWADLTTRDPAEAQRKVQETVAKLKNQTSQFGITWDDGYYNEVANAVIAWQWSDVELKNFLAGFVNTNPGQMGGTPAAVEMQINKLAGDFGITVPQSNMRDFITGIVSERYTEDNVRDYMRDMAKSKYAGMGSYLDQGMTVRQVAAPYTASYSNLLEVDADTVDLNDGLMQQALQGVSPAPGQPPQMQSVYQFERSLRRDPRWLRTKNARDSVTSAAQGVLRDWGLVG